MSNGQINNILEGRTVERALTDGQHLILSLTNGQELRIAWRDGEPQLVSVAIKLKSLSMSGIQGALG